MRRFSIVRKLFTAVIISALILTYAGPAAADTTTETAVQTSSVQEGFKVEFGLAIKSNHGLYDVETNKKIASGVRSFSYIDQGILVVKTDSTLRYMYQVSGKWKSKKLLTGVKELAEGTYVNSKNSYYLKYVYAVKNNGNLIKAKLKLKSSGAVSSFSSSTIMKKIAHAYVSAEGIMAAETASYYALKTNGRLYGWGYNEHGEIGNGKTQNVKESSPYLILKGVKEFRFAGQKYGTSPKYGTTCYAIKKNGDLMSWGINDFNTVQSGAGDAVTEPIKILDDVKCVDGASHTACAVTNDGVLWNWGTELGNYTVEGVTVIHYGIGMTPVAKNVAYADINMFNLLFIKNNKKLYYIGNSIDSKKYPTTSEPSIIASNVTAVYTTDVNGIYYLNTTGQLRGLGIYKGSKYYAKVKLGAGYPR